MRTLTFYILRELALPIVLSMAFFTVVLLMVELLDMATTLLRAGVPPSLLLQLLGIIVISLITMTFPMAVLLGILIGVGRLTAENEILAMRAAGIPVTRVFAPVVFAALLSSGALMWANSSPIPQLFQRVEAIIYQMQYDVLTSLEPGRMYDEFQLQDSDLNISYESRPPMEIIWELDPEAADQQHSQLAMEGVQVHMRVLEGQLAVDSDSRRRIRFLLYARYGLIGGNPETNEITLTLYNGTWIPLDEDFEDVAGLTRTMHFTKLETSISGPRFDDSQSLNPRMLTNRDLFEWMRNTPDVPVIRSDSSGDRIDRRWRVYFGARNELILRFTLPLAIVAFTMLAVPLALELRPRAKAFSMIIAMSLLFLYYLGMTIGEELGAKGVSWPVAIAGHMVANVVVFAAGVVLMARVMRR